MSSFSGFWGRRELRPHPLNQLDCRLEGEKRMKLQLIWITAASLVSLGGVSQDELTKSVTAAREAADAPGIAAVVQERDQAVRIACAGVRIAGRDAVIEEDDLWHLGSVSKSFTATLVGRLVEKKVVAWDDTVEQHLGELVPNLHDAHKETTFRHLLSHRSGLAANLPMKRFREFGQNPEDPITDRLKWTRYILEREPSGKREEHFEYSNDGFIVAGAMLEAKTGTSWEELMQREVFAPLELDSAGFGPPHGDKPDDQPRGHRGDNVPMPPDADNPAALGPAGRIHMSLTDLARYLRAHADRPETFLKAETFDVLHTSPFDGDYAMGWFAKQHSCWHNGSNTMWYVEAEFDSKSGRVAAVAVNDGDMQTVRRPVGELLKSLLAD